ncbi:hypothetical protein QYE76_034505 [Lolium multiflorum]|uniref:CTLH domain-containing protein n=1 Tax=Lolium multiflorum TaxID=4521 RepID=A0AAD8VKA8_LOLMU|nr:hypothetical protein QYE76_034505 [Lolium multiflorum]
MAIDRQSERIVLRRAHTFLISRKLTATARALEKEAMLLRRRPAEPAATEGVDRQSEWIVLRRTHAFLKSRDLEAAAYALEKEARLRFDYRHVSTLLEDGRWRSADEYVSSFLGGDNTRTPAAASALFVVRFQRFVDAIRREQTAWARRYLDLAVRPVLANHPDGAAAWAGCLRALDADAESLRQDHADAESLRQDHPDDARYRLRCVRNFMRCINYNAQLSRCKLSFFNDERPMRVRGGRATSTLGLRMQRLRSTHRCAPHCTPR